MSVGVPLQSSLRVQTSGSTSSSVSTEIRAIGASSTAMLTHLLLTLCLAVSVAGAPLDQLRRDSKSAHDAESARVASLATTGYTMSFCGLFKNSRKLCDHAFGVCKYCTKPGATWPQLCATKNEARHAEKCATQLASYCSQCVLTLSSCNLSAHRLACESGRRATYRGAFVKACYVCSWIQVR